MVEHHVVEYGRDFGAPIWRALENLVAQIFWFRFKLPEDMRLTIIDIHVGDGRGAAGDGPQLQPIFVADVGIDAVGGDLTDAVHKGGRAASRQVISEASAVRRVRHSGEQGPHRRLIQPLNLEVTAGCGARHGIRTVPLQQHCLRRRSFAQGQMDGAHGVRLDVGKRLLSIVNGVELAFDAQGHLGGVVQEGRGGPRVGVLNHVRVDAQQVHVEVVHREAVVFPYFRAHGHVRIPIERRLACGIDLADVGHVRRHWRELRPRRGTRLDGQHACNGVEGVCFHHWLAGMTLTQQCFQNYGRAFRTVGCPARFADTVV